MSRRKKAEQLADKLDKIKAISGISCPKMKRRIPLINKKEISDAFDKDSRRIKEA